MPPLVVFDLRPLQCGYARRGIGRYALELLRALQKRLGEKPRFRLTGLGFAGEEAPADLPVTLAAPRNERVWLWDQTILPFQLWRNKAVLFHSCAALGPLKEVNFPVPWAGRSVLTVHDWHLLADDASPLERFYRETRRWKFQHRFLKNTARVVVDADCGAAETARLGKVPTRNIRVITPGGDHLDAVAEIFPPEKDFVLSVGDGPHKGLDTAFAAVQRARELGFTGSWLVAGDAQRIRESIRIPESTPLPHWMRVAENPTDAELKGLYRRARCLLFPSRREGFGFPILEAMRLGCPVFVTALEPMSGLAGNPDAAFEPGDISSFSDGLLRVASDSGFRQSLISRGLEKAGGHTWDSAADQVLRLWEETAQPGDYL